MSLLVHPDRVEENQKAEATEKFKVLGKVHSILSDDNKRTVYDETGEFDGDSDWVGNGFNWMDYWRSLFRKITTEDIQNYERDYKGSEIEERDIKRAYMDSKGNMDYLYEAVPFLNYENEDRIMEIVKRMIDRGEVEEYKSFTNEPKKKKERRKKKWEKEQAEAVAIDRKFLVHS